VHRCRFGVLWGQASPLYDVMYSTKRSSIPRRLRHWRYVLFLRFLLRMRFCVNLLILGLTTAALLYIGLVTSGFIRFSCFILGCVLCVLCTKCTKRTHRLQGWPCLSVRPSVYPYIGLAIQGWPCLSAYMNSHIGLAIQDWLCLSVRPHDSTWEPLGFGGGRV
jgi:hypothetical protein